MSDFLKGNFTPKHPVTGASASPVDDSVEARFEREALKRLGGSIAFVAKKKVMWEAESTKPAPVEAEARRESETEQAKSTEK